MPNRIEIARFPQNKRIAVTLSFDDGVPADQRALESFNNWGLKATWNLNSGAMGKPHPHNCTHLPATEIAKTYAGHEVAIHSVTHPHLPHLDPTQIALEIINDRIALEDLVGYPVRGMAYPCGTYNTQVIDILRALGIVYARTIERSDAPFPPKEPLAWAPTAHQFDENLPQKWTDFYNGKWSSGVFFIWGHTYEFDDHNDWPALERIFKPLSQKPDIWYCTNIQLFDYEKARNQIILAANRKTAVNPTATALTLLVDGKPIPLPPGATIQLT